MKLPEIARNATKHLPFAINPPDTTATAGNGDVGIELLAGLGQFERLTNHHLRGDTTEVLAEFAIVDGDLAGARLEEYAGRGSLAAPGTVVLL